MKKIMTLLLLSGIAATALANYSVWDLKFSGKGLYEENPGEFTLFKGKSYAAWVVTYDDGKEVQSTYIEIWKGDEAGMGQGTCDTDFTELTSTTTDKSETGVTTLDFKINISHVKLEGAALGKHKRSFTSKGKRYSLSLTGACSGEIEDDLPGYMKSVKFRYNAKSSVSLNESMDPEAAMEAIVSKKFKQPVKLNWAWTTE